MKRFHHDLRLQFNMYTFMYVDTETMPEDAYFPETKTFVEKYNKRSIPEPVPKYWLGFSYICSEYHELDINFDENK